MTRLLMRRSMLALTAACAASAGARARAPLKTAFLPFTLTDTSRPYPGQLPEPADLARLALVGQQVMRLLQDSGAYIAVDTKPIAKEIAENDLGGCDGCAVALARQVGAQAVVTGLVQKVSLLIIDMSIAIRAVPSGRMIAAGTTGLRGDNDLAWERAASWLVAHRLLR